MVVGTTSYGYDVDAEWNMIGVIAGWLLLVVLVVAGWWLYGRGAKYGYVKGRAAADLEWARQLENGSLALDIPPGEGWWTGNVSERPEAGC